MKNDKLKFGVINWSDNGVMEKKGEKKESIQLELPQAWTTPGKLLAQSSKTLPRDSMY